MDNERPSEYRSWRHRLEEPGALREVGLTDKEATWDKLYDRLGETPRRRTLPWMWTAAACLLLALIPAAFFLREKRRPSNPQKVAVRPKTNVLPTPAPGPEPSIVIRNTMQAPPSRNITPLRPDRSEKPAQAKNPVRALAPIALQSPVRTPLPERLLPPNPDLSGPLIIASTQAAPKKELRIVHINELESLQPTPAAARTGQRLKPGRLYIGLHPEPDAFRPATTYEIYQTDHPIILFKHTTPNP